MGTIRKQGNFWYVDLRVKGKRLRKKAGNYKHLPQLLLKDLELKAERDQLDFIERKNISVKDFINEYLTYCKTNFRKSTYIRYRSALENFYSFLQINTQIRNLSEITTHTIERFKTWRKTTKISKNGKKCSKQASYKIGAKNYTINFEIAAVKTALNLAIKWGYLGKNPVSGVKKLKTDDAKKRKFLTEEECQALLEVSPKEYFPVFFTFLNTAMRCGELVNLEWRDIDLERREIKIQRKPFWNPKTGERVIPINQELFELLISIPKKRKFVFLSKKGKKLSRNYVRENLVRTAESAGISELSEVHALRHTAISRMIERGADLPSVQRVAGHSEIQTTMIYTHQSASQIRSAVERLCQASDKYNLNGFNANKTKVIRIG